ncbi:ArsR/SmtB family transcription factor [Insolitispirillum peregrinum]|uniref:Transcriptional regulator, ArsR family n=1 Tax=Insolitispirillum peregrinum TaxID=80876 RepID=A0A1N7NQC7_9PROT|nr:metalloregulator ArsR/SmtB family transcription factor [Insolitispirillum peregrinum]SIT00521.1 transcriptional regulator, ArsR family [Insolitispirillum peregrinum]
MNDILAALRAAGEETRLRLLALCDRADLTVSDLTRILGQSQPRISRHLKVLCDSNLLTRLREGSWVFFRLERQGPIATLIEQILAQLPADDPVLLRDRARLEAVQTERASAAQAYFRDNAAQWNAIRSLYVEDAAVEEALVAILSGGNADYRLGHLLDIGTGTGRMLSLLGGHADSAVGIDQSREMLALARTALEDAGLRNCLVRQGDMYALPVDDASMTVVIIHQVLHFAETPAAAIAEAARVLAPGGRLMVVDFAPHDLEYLRDQHNHRRLGFSVEEVEDWCRRAALSPLSTHDLAGRPQAGQSLTVRLWLAERPAT